MSAVPKQSTSDRATAARSAKAKTMSIGVVLEKLTAEFPDITVSKIRFLESEGLITPQRSSSGYRRFTEADVDRLRYILRTQRDNYLPLKVIRQQLEAMDSGAVASLHGHESDTIVSPESFKEPALTKLSEEDVTTQAGVDPEWTAKLIAANVIVPDASGFFTADDVSIVSTASQLREFGFDARHLKSLRNTASRQADLIERAALPTASKRDGKQRAEDMMQQMMALVVSMHANFVKSELRR